MKKVLLLAGAMLALTSSLALAQGNIDLAWNDCSIGWGGVGLSDQANNCNNTGALTLVASFSPPDTMKQFNGHAGVVDIQVAAASLDNWWHLETGGCRAGRMSGSFDFVAGPFSCFDVWAGGASGGINLGTIGANRIRARTVCAIPGVTQVDPGVEYYVFKLTISKVQSTGVGSCAGCTDPACIVFNQILVTQPAGVGDFTITTGPQQYATYKGGTGVTSGCPLATPTRKGTWGSVKALYR